MYKVIKAKSKSIFPVVQEIIGNGGKAKITVTGNSMRPFLRENTDEVELSKAVYTDVSRGDIVLILRDSGAYVLHRIIKKEENCFYMVGDNQQSIEGPLRPDQIIAVATAIFRKDRRIDCNNIILKSLVGLWMLILPHRQLIKKLYHYPHVIINKVIKKIINKK